MLKQITAETEAAVVEEQSKKNKETYIPRRGGSHVSRNGFLHIHQSTIDGVLPRHNNIRS